MVMQPHVRLARDEELVLLELAELAKEPFDERQVVRRGLRVAVLELAAGRDREPDTDRLLHENHVGKLVPRVLVVGQVAVGLRPERALPSRRRDCHSAAPRSTFSRCFNRDGERASAKSKSRRRLALLGHEASEARAARPAVGPSAGEVSVAEREQDDSVVLDARWIMLTQWQNG